MIWRLILKNDKLKFDSEADETFLRLWASVMDKQDTINKQLEESEKNYNQKVENDFRQIEESEKKFLLLMKELLCWITGKKN